MTTVEEQPADHEWDLLVSPCSRPGTQSVELPCGMGADGGVTSHEIFWCVKELAKAVILDIGCLKSVAGTKSTNSSNNGNSGIVGSSLK